MIKPDSQQGMVDFQTLVILVSVVFLVAGAFWYVVNRDKPESKTTRQSTAQTTARPTVKDSDLPQIYTDTTGNFSVSYPAGWQVQNNQNGSAEDPISATTLAAPSGNTKVYLTYQHSYIPSDCIPDYYDKPFLPTNRCFSAEYLSAIPVPVGKADWYLSHYHFKTITINAREVYASCLASPKPDVNKPEMGFFLDHPFSPVAEQGNITGYLAACVDAGSSPSDYARPEVGTGEAILRSLRFNNT